MGQPYSRLRAAAPRSGEIKTRMITLDSFPGRLSPYDWYYPRMAGIAHTGFIHMPESQFFCLLSVVFMMGCLFFFDKMHWQRKYGWQLANLMTQEESRRFLRIISASQEDEALED